MKWMFWHWLEENHPVIYEVVWMAILVMSVVALGLSIIQIVQ